MNTALTHLYSYYWEDYIKNIVVPTANSDHACAYPYLIYSSAHYQKSTKRIMICGQETYGWGDKEYPNFENVTPENIQSIYHEFVNKSNNSIDDMVKPGYNSPYWNFSRQIMQAHPEYGYDFQNIVKIGREEEKGCDDVLFDYTLKYFPVWKEELDILKPNIILFLTGPGYDWRIKRILGDFRKVSVDDDLDKLLFDDSSLPLCYRTYHPGYLQRSNKYYRMIESIKYLL